MISNLEFRGHVAADHGYSANHVPTIPGITEAHGGPEGFDCWRDGLSIESLLTPGAGAGVRRFFVSRRKRPSSRPRPGCRVTRQRSGWVRSNFPGGARPVLAILTRLPSVPLTRPFEPPVPIRL